MDRKVLKYFLMAGPARKFPVLDFYLSAAKADPENPARLFHTTALNKAYILKFLDTEDYRNTGDKPPVKTMIYLPYDVEAPTQGGESMFYTKDRILDYTGAAKSDDEALMSQTDEDIAILDVLDSVPSFNPFLLEDAFDRAGIEIPPAYLSIEEKHSAAIKNCIRGRIRPLITAAMGADSEGAEKAIDSFVDSIWQLDDMAKIRPLTQVLGIPDADAEETLRSWCGLTFFEQEYQALAPELRQVAEWMAKFARPSETLPREMLEGLDMTANTARNKIQQGWRSGQETLNGFRDSFDGFVGEKRDVQSFIAFLKGAKGHFWQVGEVLGRLEQAVYAWRSFTRDSPNKPLSYDRLTEFYFVVNQAV